MNKKKAPPNNKGMPTNKSKEFGGNVKGMEKNMNDVDAFQSGNKIKRRSLNQPYIDDQRPKG